MLLNTTTEVLLYAALFLTRVRCSKILTFTSTQWEFKWVHQDHTQRWSTFYGPNHAEIFWSWRFPLDLGNSKLEKRNSRCRFPTSNTSWGLQLRDSRNNWASASTEEGRRMWKKMSSKNRLDYFSIFWIVKCFFFFIAVRIGSFSTYFHCLK